MRSLKILTGVLASVVLAFFAQHAFAQRAVQQAVMQASTTTMTTIQDRSLPGDLQPGNGAHESGGSGMLDTLLATMAGVVMIALRLRRHQKTELQTRIISLNGVARFNVRTARHVMNMSQVAEPQFIVHAEQR